MKVSCLHYSNSVIDLNKTFGMQVMELGELRELSRRGIDARLFAKDIIGDHQRIMRLPYHKSDKSLYDIPYYTRFVDENCDADILQGNSTPLLAAFEPKKTVIRFDGAVNIPMYNDEKIAHAYDQVQYIFVSKFLKNAFFKKYSFVTRSNSHVLHNAVENLGVGSGSITGIKRMLFCSRWVPYKGVNVLLDTLKGLSASRNDYEVLVAGGVQTSARNQNPSLKKLEDDVRGELERIKNVKVLGFVQHEELLKLFRSVDLVLFPSLYQEPFGLVPAEAAMAGVSSVAFSVGGVPEVIKHNETGIVLKKSRYRFLNSRRFLRAINELLNDENLLKKLGHNARLRALEKFSWNNYVDQLLGIYDGVASCSKHS